MRCDRRRAVSSHSASVQHNYTTCRDLESDQHVYCEVQYVWGQSLRKICRKFYQIASTSSLDQQFLCQQLCFWLVSVFYAGLGAIFGFDTCSTVLSASCWYDTFLCSARLILLCKVLSVFNASGIRGARSQIWAQSTWQIWIMRSNVQVNNGYHSWNYHHSHNIEMCRWIMDIIVGGNHCHSHNI